MFEASTDYAREFSTHSPTTRTVTKLTVHEYDEAKNRLEKLINGQAADQHHATNKPKETNHGKHSTNRSPQFPRRTLAKSVQAGGGPQQSQIFLHGQSISADGVRSGQPKQHCPTKRASEVVQQQTKGIGGGRTRWTEQFNRARNYPNTSNRTNDKQSDCTADTTGGGGVSGGYRPSPIPSEQNAGKSIRSAPSNIPYRLSSLPMTAADIDEQIRKLCIAMNGASLDGQVAIQQHINELVGRKECLPRPK
jgi:hypothetical protein